MKALFTATVLGLAGMLGGCATVTTGTTQPINVDSEPQAAECTLTREGVALGTVTTPAPITIKRHASTLHVVCKKAGYGDGRVIMNSRFETASAGNFVLGGMIGVMVDSSTGANSRYEGSVLVRLEPLSPADQARTVAMAPAPAKEVAAGSAPPPPELQRPATFSGPWKATAVLMSERSRSGCTHDGGAYSLDLANNMFTVDNATGRAFSVAVPADGAVKQTFRSPVTTASRFVAPLVGTAEVDMVGNARTRELEIVDGTAGCRWKLRPD